MTDGFLKMSSYELSFNSDVCGFVLLTSALFKVTNGEKIFVIFFYSISVNYSQLTTSPQTTNILRH